MAVLKSFFLCVWKVVDHFCNFQVFFCFFFADQCSQTIDNCWWPTLYLQCCISGSSQDVNVSSWLILMVPFNEELISFSTKSMIWVIGWFETKSMIWVWLPLFKTATQSVKLCTSPFLKVSASFILANDHWLQWQSCSLNFFLSFHFCLFCKLCRNSFLYLCNML